MNDLSLEERINTKFCAKLGKNAHDTCEMLFEANEGEAMEKNCS